MFRFNSRVPWVRSSSDAAVLTATPLGRDPFVRPPPGERGDDSRAALAPSYTNRGPAPDRPKRARAGPEAPQHAHPGRTETRPRARTYGRGAALPSEPLLFPKLRS